MVIASHNLAVSLCTGTVLLQWIETGNVVDCNYATGLNAPGFEATVFATHKAITHL